MRTNTLFVLLILLGIQASTQTFDSEYQKAREYLNINLDSALYYTKSASSLSSNESNEARSYFMQGYIHENQGVIHQAIEFYLKSIRVYKKVGDHGQIQLLYDNLGAIALNNGKYKAAMIMYQKRIHHAQKLTYREHADALLSLGQAEKGDKKYSKSIKTLFDARKLVEEYGSLQDTVLLSNIYLELGRSFNVLALADYNKKYTDTARFFTRQSGDLYSTKFNLAKVINNIGYSYLVDKQYRDANHYFHQALVLKRELGYDRLTLTTLNYLGKTHFSLNQYPESYAYFMESISLNSIEHNNFIDVDLDQVVEFYISDLAQESFRYMDTLSRKLNMQLYPELSSKLYQLAADRIENDNTIGEAFAGENVEQMLAAEHEAQVAETREIVTYVVICLLLLVFSGYAVKMELARRDIKRYIRQQFKEREVS